MTFTEGAAVERAMPGTKQGRGSENCSLFYTSASMSVYEYGFLTAQHPARADSLVYASAMPMLHADSCSVIIVELIPGMLVGSLTCIGDM